MKVGVLGTGTIATAVVRGIAADQHFITVSERSADNAATLSAEFSNVSVASNQQVLDCSDVILLGLMPDIAPSVLGELEFYSRHRVISMIADIPLDTLGPMVSPALVDSIIIPYPSIAYGGSPLILLGDGTIATSLVGDRNSIYRVESLSELQAYLCAQSVLSPVTRLVGDASVWLGSKVEDRQQAERFLRELVSSSLSASDCENLIEALNTPGGYNQRLRLHMEGRGIRSDLIDGLDDLA